MSNIDIVFENIFKIAVVSLHVNGTYPSVVRNKLWVIRSLFVLIINLLCFFLLSYSILVKDIRKSNFTEACKNIAMLIVCMNATMKFLIMIYNRESILDMIRIVNDDYELAKQFTQEEQDVVKRYAREGRMVCIVWGMSAASTSAIFPIKAFVLTVHSYWIKENQLKPMFDISFADIIETRKDQLPIYCSLFALCFTFAFFAVVMYIGFDPLIPIFTLHTCGQLDILGRRISVALSESTPQEKNENLKRIVKKLQQLYHLVSEVQRNFTVLNEFNMKSTTIVLPLTGFNIVDNLRNNEINCEFYILFACATLHFLMPCYFSDLLMERSEEFRKAIYSCGWEKHPDSSVRQTVLFMLTRASRPLSISSVFYKISLDTFSTSMKQSYALFNLMNAAWGNSNKLNKSSN